MNFLLATFTCAFAYRADEVFGHIKKERIRLGPVDNPPGLIHFYPYRDFAVDNEELHRISNLTNFSSDLKLGESESSLESFKIT